MQRCHAVRWMARLCAPPVAEVATPSTTAGRGSGAEAESRHAQVTPHRAEMRTPLHRDGSYAGLATGERQRRLS